MDNKENNNEYDMDIENESLNNKPLSREEQIYEIEIRMQEIDAQVELYEETLYKSVETTLELEELEKLRREYIELRRQKKVLTKQEKGKWDKMPVPLFIYGVFQVIFSSFFVLVMVSAIFQYWFLTNFFTGAVSLFWEYFGILFIPFISLVISSLLFLFIKEKMAKKFYTIVYSIQVIETLITVIFMIRTMQ